ncbi:MAG: hypothetical protein ACR2QZ_08885 [Woeseiaceae bacterium]
MFNYSTAVGKSVALSRGVPGLLLMLLLNMAVLPCAMAFQSDDCAHCPPAEQHEEDHKMAAHHGHDEASAKPDCATVQSDCCDEVATSVDSRGGKLEWKSASEVVFVTAPLADNSELRPLALWRSSSGPPQIGGTPPPLYVLFCVYLK